ncbi:MAG: hypothetical protein HY744_01275 [Deltaproteobacteria bacterium]|nr:hypothetical protein [Deltaproteobacteria bacterium]
MRAAAALPTLVAGPLLLALAACAAPAGEQAPAAEPRAAVADEEGQVVAEGPTGGLSEYDVEQTFGGLQPEIRRCVEPRAAQLPALGGTLELVLRIGRDGRALDAFFRHSSLGDREAERCILAAVFARRWPRPLGGNGTAEHRFDVDPAQPPVERDAGRLPHALGAIRAATARCIARVRGRFVATLYLGRDGTVLAAGVAVPSAAGERQADCVAEALLGLRLWRQKRAVTKITARLR